MQEAPRRRITVTSSLYEISTELLGNRVVVRGKGGTPPTPASAHMFEDDVSGFPSSRLFVSYLLRWDLCFFPETIEL
jgi:hypothetical protein